MEVIRARGGKVAVVDLRRTRTAEVASAKIDILAISAGHFDRPGTSMFGNPVVQ